MAESLKDARIIPDIIDDFKPTIDLSAPLKNGQAIKPSDATMMPDVELNGTHSGCLYTMVMADPDAPSPDDPKMREWVHWIVTNIPAGKEGFANGQQILGYAGPTPPRGTHRYAFIVFEQPGGGNTVATHAPKTRGNFSTKTFAADLGLKPVGGFFFTAAHSE